MFKHILMPTDGTEHSEQAIKRGIELAKLCNAKVTGIHVVPDYHMMVAYEGGFDTVTEERIQEEALSRIRQDQCRRSECALRHRGGDEPPSLRRDRQYGQ
jgi:nucleotide-binding universal stress UspA family protein